MNMKKNVHFLLIIVVVAFTPFLLNVYAEENADEYNGYIIKIKEQTQKAIMLQEYLPLSDLVSCGNGVYIAADKDTAQRFALQAEYIEPNYKVELLNTYNYDTYMQQVNVRLTSIKSAWDIGCYGNNVRIGVIDSGVYEHNALKGNLSSGYNYLSKDTDTTDHIGHGTMVSGIIAAQYGYGVIGMAHHAKIIPLKCFENGQATYINTIVSAIYDAVDRFNCDIINLSLGLQNKSTALEEAVNYAVSKGVLLVASVGNDSNSAFYYPASYDSVIGVGSVNSSKVRSGFSNYNNSVFVTAPGENIIGLSIKGGYVINSGTSFSAPVVTGIIATMFSIDNSLDVAAVKNIFMNTSEDLGPQGYDTEYGYGLVNAEAIVNYMLSGKDYFVSPIDTQNENFSEVRVWKNPSVTTYPLGIWASYDNNRITDIKTVSLSFANGSIEILQYSNEYKTLKFFLWYNMKSLLPISPSRSVRR